jgi:hypothetical protein
MGFIKDGEWFRGAIDDVRAAWLAVKNGSNFNLRIQTIQNSFKT